MIKKQVTLLMIYSLLLFFCCTNTLQVSNGNGSETTNGKIILSNGLPASKAKIYLIPESLWLFNIANGKNPVSDSIIANDSGYFRIPSIKLDKYKIQVSAFNEGIIINGNLLTNVVTLSPFSVLKGSIQKSDIIQTEILLGKTALSTKINTDNSFILEGIPSGVYPLLIKFNENISLYNNFTFKAGDTIIVNNINSDNKNIIIDDFEDKDNRTNLGFLIGSGWWEVYSDSFTGGTSALVSPVNGEPNNFSNAIINDGNLKTNCLNIKYSLGSKGPLDSHPFSYVYAGFNIGNGFYDLSSFDTLSFFAKGNGSVSVEFIQHPANLGIIIYASAMRELSTNWTQIQICPQDLIVTVELFPNSVANLQDSLVKYGLPSYTQKPSKWEDICTAINKIHFVFTNGSEVYIDDIRLHGISLNGFIK